MNARSLRGLLLTAALLGLSSCEGGSVTEPWITLPGTYRLVSINGAPLPHLVARSTGFALYTDGTLTLRRDGHYTLVLEYTAATPGLTETFSGIYVRTDPETFELEMEGRPDFTGIRLSRSRIRVTEGGLGGVVHEFSR